jgi:hypothetical protein
MGYFSRSFYPHYRYLELFLSSSLRHDMGGGEHFERGVGESGYDLDRQKKNRSVKLLRK